MYKVISLKILLSTAVLEITVSQKKGMKRAHYEMTYK